MSALSDLVKYAQTGDVRYQRGDYNEKYSRANEAAAELKAKDDRISELLLALDETSRNTHEVAMSLASHYHSGSFDECESVFCKDARAFLTRGKTS